MAARSQPSVEVARAIVVSLPGSFLRSVDPWIVWLEPKEAITQGKQCRSQPASFEPVHPGVARIVNLALPASTVRKKLFCAFPQVNRG